MTRHTSYLTLAAAALIAVPAMAQQNNSAARPASRDTTRPADSAAVADTTKRKPALTAAEKRNAQQPAIQFQHLRPVDQRGLNGFEPAKEDTVTYDGFKLGWGAAFTQQMQGLSHSNTAAPKIVNNVNQNQLIGIGNGFNNAVANLYLNAQLARGIRVQLETYLSSRHHDEVWVKDGYLLVDASPIDQPLLNAIMQNVTLRVGHFEINYGDAHFRRTDNGNAINNPMVGNYIMDAFTTEIGAEAYFRKNGFLAMAGMTGGEVHGQVTAPEKRAPSYLAKLGVDKQLSKDLRFRLTGSMYATDKSANNTLYSGDRAGSRYYDVLENTTSTELANAWSGAIQPGMSSKVRAFVVNPFVKIKGFEAFGNLETVSGRAATETANRTFHQWVGEALYRFAPADQLYVGARYNKVNGYLKGIANEVNVDRWQYGGGWFVTPSIEAKIEYVRQRYNNFPALDIRNGGKFNGFMVEGVVAF